jgi:diketogulonate reductase-like aldo/keto reductase
LHDCEKERKELDCSLKRLKMDNVDFVLAHSLEPTVDIAALEKGGTFSRTAGIAEMAQVQGSRSHIS